MKRPFLQRFLAKSHAQIARAAIASIAILSAVGAPQAQAQSAPAQAIVVASTTSTEQSGLFKHLLPAFEKASGVAVKVVALGTGQAIDMGRRGDADVLFVHDRVAEEKALAEGFAIDRHDVMYNDFVLVGPKADPAHAQGNDIVAALKAVAQAGAGFVSRGDKSGTHAAELRFWTQSGVSPAQASGYKSCGCGMGPALNMGAASNAYVLTDRGTWLNFKNRADLVVLVQGDKRLFNQYGVMRVNPAKYPHVKTQAAQTFVNWLISPAGQQTIADYKIGGEQLFFPNAKP